MNPLSALNSDGSKPDIKERIHQKDIGDGEIRKGKVMISLWLEQLSGQWWHLQNWGASRERQIWKKQLRMDQKCAI